MKNKKVFITGCGGMLGNAIYPFFRDWYSDVLATDKDVNEEWLSSLDVRDEDELRRTFKEYKPDYVLHLAAETDLEFCETHADTATDTNDIATKNIAKFAEEFGSTLVYISTAGVFDGKKDGAYTEADQPNPLMVYGETKYMGEVHALEHCSKSFVIRAGWMMGGGRRKEKKFIYKILKQIGAGQKEIFAVTDKWGTPTYTYDFAMNLFLLLETRKYGRYHMVCEGRGTRYDVAREILRICKREDIKLTPVGSDFFEKEYFAPRPFSEMMMNENLNHLQINHMRPWQDALGNYIQNHFPDYINGVRTASKYKSGPEVANGKINGSGDRRKFFRHNFPSMIEYKVANGVESSLIAKGITVNRSDSGLCLYVFLPIEEGQKLKILEGNLPVRCGSGVVQWIHQEKNGLFKVGLKLNE